MKIEVFENPEHLGKAAAARAGQLIREAVQQRGLAHLIVATGASQFTFLDALVREPGIDWKQAVFFHLDEYVGLPDSHPASFRKYLRERIVDRVQPGTFHFVDGEAADLEAECRRLGELISAHPIDGAFVGIGENGHLAFNDPPADFETTRPYLLVELDEACRRQQFGEGWFQSLEDVPKTAISMSIPQILKSREILCIVPDLRKAEAVRSCLELEISPQYPASALRLHPNARLYLDQASASLLKPETLSA